MNKPDKDRDDYVAVTQEAYKHLMPSINGFIGTLGKLHPSTSGNAMFFAVETALIEHAARIAVFRKLKFGGNITAETFAEIASAHFDSMLKLSKDWKGTK